MSLDGSAANSAGDLAGLRSNMNERTRIAQDLHDTLLQGFLAASMQLHVAVDSLPADCPAKRRFTCALHTVDRAVEEGRRAIEGLQSPYSSFQSLGHALAGVPNDLGLPPAVEFRVIVEGRRRELRAGMGDQLYRIGREAIFNAYRHAQAKRIETEIEYRPTELRIAVRDDGCGIDTRLLERAGHWGLRGMRERAERMGAQLRVLSRIALGTEIELSVPSRVVFEQS